VILWVAGPAMLVFGLLVAGLYLRGRGSGGDPVPDALTEADKARLETLLKD
jgi:cytochrome c-type biogenesis protein CcmH